MVILETAAIGAAGYGLYRGGDAAVRKGKDVHKEMKREQHRQGQRRELAAKQKERSERLAKITDLRNGKPTSSWSTPAIFGTSSNTNTTNTAAGSADANAPSWLTAPTPSAAAASSSSTTSKNNEINDRYQNVLKKLDEKPKKKEKKNPLSKIFKKF